MRSYWPRLAAAATCLLTIVGCGRSPAPPAGEPSQATVPETKQEIAETTVVVVDPKGRWRFEVQANQVEAASVHGPYTMQPAHARYQEVGRPPVLMSARRAHVDEVTRRITLQGDVRLSSATWLLEADRVDYDLPSGKVVATGQTKWTLTEGSGSDGRPPPAQKEQVQ